MTVFDQIERLFAERGDAAYFGEPVSQTEHALQTAWLAEQSGASDALIVAALLHDIGHLVHGLEEQIADEGIDGRHEAAGAVWLARHFGTDVIDPIRLHVAAKRYLCAVDSEYRKVLSSASVQSLQLQGGPFSPCEVEAFEKEPHHRAAILLRRLDDQAKIPQLAVPGLTAYRDLVNQVQSLKEA
jgi:[1-hydroxy-2-(trimethylamino)ethyl]phosphonate dioxygenase